MKETRNRRALSVDIFFQVCSACFALRMLRDGSLILYPGVMLVDNEKGRITELFPTGVEVI